MRIRQYVKNLLIFLPIFFSAKINNLDILLLTGLAFIAFSAIASSVYIINDIMDVGSDRKHPKKCFRPIASGKISTKQALLPFFICLPLGLILSFSLNILPYTGAYLLLNLLYSLRLKEIPILDISTVSTGFVIRLLVGAEIANIDPSMWIVQMTFLLSVFLVLGKRRHDILVYQKTGKKVRSVIDGYNLEFINGSMLLMSGIIIVSYIMYCASPEVQERIKSNKLYLTSIFVIVGLLKYLHLAFVERRSDAPVEVLLKDPLILTTVIMWMCSFAYFIY